MIETVIALLLIVDHEIKEHRIQDSLSKCLKGKRVAERELKSDSRVSYKCIKSKANIEIYMGEKKITSLIME
jgi:hypothetical protein|tara:strand:- start:75 stop:290 length:216 start_codon:yes stop_codon:yes gene_type:complete